MITRIDADNAIVRQTMCYAPDGQSVTLVKIKENRERGMWLVLAEYGDGSRMWTQPAEITLSAVKVLPLADVTNTDDLFYQYSDDNGRTFGTYALVSGATAQVMHRDCAERGLRLGTDYRFIKA